MYAMRQRLRTAQSRMKGVKLQYTEEQRPIMFEDVAGIGEAKASFTGRQAFLKLPLPANFQLTSSFTLPNLDTTNIFCKYSDIGLMTLFISESILS